MCERSNRAWWDLCRRSVSDTNTFDTFFIGPISADTTLYSPVHFGLRLFRGSLVQHGRVCT
jgi:hypothetical protein